MSVHDLVETALEHKTTERHDDGTCTVKVDEVTELDVEKSYGIDLVDLTDETQRCMGTAIDFATEDGKFVMTVHVPERMVLVYNRWFNQSFCDDENNTCDTFSGFRRAFADNDVADLRARIGEPVLEPWGTKRDDDTELLAVDETTMNFIHDVAKEISRFRIWESVVPFKHVDVKKNLRGVVALGLEFKRVRKGRQVDISETKFNEVVERVVELANKHSRWVTTKHNVAIKN